MQKIILFYKFTPILDPETLLFWQRSLCQKLNLKGRIIISDHGINGTLGGEIKDLKLYISEMRLYKPLKTTEFKWSSGGRKDFPKLSIKVRDEIVTFGAKGELVVDEGGVVGGGKKLKPQQLEKLAREKGKDLVFFDGRNSYESAIGKFKNALTPNVRTSDQFLNELDKPEYENIKDKAVVTYCTGGIRCEVLSMLMKNRGFKEVYQLDGGIAKYGEKYGDKSLWEGSLFVFDKRMNINFSEDSIDIGKCVHCKKPTSRYVNCSNKICNKLTLVCVKCKDKDYCIDEGVAKAAS